MQEEQTHLVVSCASLMYVGERQSSKGEIPPFVVGSRSGLNEAVCMAPTSP